MSGWSFQGHSTAEAVWECACGLVLEGPTITAVVRHRRACPDAPDRDQAGLGRWST